MNKKLLLIPVGVGLLIWILFMIFDSDPVHGSKFEMTIPKVVKSSESNIRAVDLYIDFSGSMKGYIDFQPNNKKDTIFAKSKPEADMIPMLTKLLNNINSTYSVESNCHCNKKVYGKDDFSNAMRDRSVFGGSVTRLDGFFKQLVEQASDTSIVIAVSDMVMSYGVSELQKKGKDYNRTQMAQISSDVHTAMTNAHTKGLDVLLLQYYSPYNGKYYCNYTENIDANKFKDSLMLDRPYYIMMVASRNNLESIMQNDCINRKDLKGIYTSFVLGDNFDSQCYNVSTTNSSASWYVGDIENDTTSKDNTGELWADKSNLDENTKSEFTFSCKRFELPKFIKEDKVEQLNLVWDNKCIDSVLLKDDATDTLLTYIVKLKRPGDLNSGETWFLLNSASSSMASAHIDDDVNISLDGMRGKTWGFGKIIDGFDEVYKTPKQSEMARFKFKVSLE